MRRQFYYKGQDYLHRDYTETYTRVSRWIRIRYNMSGDPFFIYDGHRYKLDDFLRTNTMWSVGIADKVEADNGEQVSLAGYEAEQYYKPLFVELSETCEAVRLYRYEGTEREE